MKDSSDFRMDEQMKKYAKEWKEMWGYWAHSAGWVPDGKGGLTTRDLAEQVTGAYRFLKTSTDLGLRLRNPTRHGYRIFLSWNTITVRLMDIPDGDAKVLSSEVTFVFEGGYSSPRKIQYIETYTARDLLGIPVETTTKATFTQSENAARFWVYRWGHGKACYKCGDSLREAVANGGV